MKNPCLSTQGCYWTASDLCNFTFSESFFEASFVSFDAFAYT